MPVVDNFFLARQFADLADMNSQLRQWLDTVANVRVHGTTDRVVAEHFAQERPALQALPAGRFDAVLRAERRVSNDGCVSVGGNYYSVPDGTRRRVLDVESTADQVRIHEGGQLIATHALLQGRKQRSVLPGHRHLHRSQHHRHARTVPAVPGNSVATRSLQIYEFVGRQLGSQR